MGSRILIIEDDERIRVSLRMLLEDEGHTVIEAGTGEEGLDVMSTHPADVLLLDVNLPGIDGYTVCRTLRRSSDVPILMLTARNDSHDVVAGLEAGADDYVTKPAVPKELAARVRALLRRARRADDSPELLRFGKIEIEREAGVVRKSGSPVPLTKTEFLLLCELASQPGKVLSREALLDKVWGYDYFGDSRLVDVHVRRLRAKVEDDPANPTHVLTVRGLGYKLQQ
ncbi:MAG TPA: response regulator transcription factor [Acidimicrobiales bacterium]|nr:response regulator transcription factor [Acidimicrobiales bacterium]